MRKWIAPAALCLALALLPLGAQAAETGPQWGTEVQWSYDEDTYTLELTGSGPMPKGAPPCASLSYVEKLVIGEGITSVSAGAFQDCSDLRQVSIPSSVTSIGDQAFYGCYWLTGVAFPGKLTSIGRQAFSDCGSLAAVTLPGDGISIGDGAFYNCSKLATVTFSGTASSIGSEAFSGCGPFQCVFHRLVPL